MNDAIFGHAFNQIENFGAINLKKVFDAFGSFKDAWEANPTILGEKIREPFFVRLILENKEKIDPEKEWKKITSAGISAITISNPAYPPLLKEITFPPALLYFFGDISSLFFGYSVAIVGTRRATYYGLETAFKLSRDLALNGINVVSGLALGIDAQAHRGCLGISEGLSAEALAKAGKTFAVLGSGLLKIQPRTNFELSQRIIKKGGALISEYPPLLNADKWTFPQRNRIIAGLTQASVIIEAPERSGALITAKFALDANRDVGVVPGDINSIISKGSNKLLKRGAFPICGTEDVLEMLGVKEIEKNILENRNFDEEETIILNALKNSSSAEELIALTGLEPKIFNQKMTFLELKGTVKNENGIIRIAKN